MTNPLALAIHGGAGALKPGTYSEEELRLYMQTLKECRELGERLLLNGESSLNVCVEVVKVLEDSPLFNAGIGSVYNSEEIQEMDASVMDGKSMAVGGVSLLTRIKNPIEGALCVMGRSEHSMLAGPGAEKFLASHGFDFVDPKIFHSDKRLKQLHEARDKGVTQLDHTNKMGTVGCVALDIDGNLAAATSTGGMTNRHPGRVSDTSIIGSGNYAENGVVAISGTGTGDQFIAGTLAYDLACRMKYGKLSLEEAAAEALERLNSLGGSGGFALVDSKGKIHLPFNSLGMFRAWWTSAGDSGEAVYQLD